MQKKESYTNKNGLFCATRPFAFAQTNLSKAVAGEQKAGVEEAGREVLVYRVVAVVVPLFYHFVCHALVPPLLARNAAYKRAVVALLMPEVVRLRTALYVLLRAL